MTDEFRTLFDPSLGLLDCACVGLAEQTLAAIEGRDLAPCPIHEPAAVHAREVEQERAEAEARLAASRATLDKVDPEGAQRRGLTERRADVDPLALHLAALTGASPDPNRWGHPGLAVGDDAGLDNVLRGIFGPDSTDNEPHDYDDAA